MRRTGLMVLVLAFVVAAVAAPGSGSASAEDRLFQVTILHFGNGESAVAAEGGAGGLDRFVELVRREHTRAIQSGGDLVIGLGDHFDAGPQFAAAREEPGPALDALALSRVPADAYVIGDRDLELGTDTFAELVDGIVRGDSRPTFVSTTVDTATDPNLAPLADTGRIATSTVVTRWGRPMGVVGVTSPDALMTGGARVTADVVGAAQAEVDRLTSAGVDIVVVASHLASLQADLDLIARLDGVDLALSGSDDVLADAGVRLAAADQARVAGNYPLLQTDRRGRYVPVAAVGSRYRYLGRLVAWFDGDGEIVRLAPSSAPLVVDDSVAAQRFVGRQVVDESRERVAAQPLTPLAVSQVELDGVRASVRTAESNLGNLVADAVLAEGQDEAAIVDRAPPEIALVGAASIGFDHVVAAGPVSVRDSFDLTSDDLVVLSGPVSRARLKRILEFAVAGAEDVAPAWVQVAGLSMVVELERRPVVLAASGRVEQSGRRVRSVTLDSGEQLVVDGQVIDGDPVLVAFDESLIRLGHPLGGLADARWVGTTVQQALSTHLVDRLSGAVGARDYPEGGEGRIVRPGVPPRP